MTINKFIRNDEPCPEFADISMNKGHDKEQCDLDYGHIEDHRAERVMDDGTVYILNWKLKVIP